jgi:hypothetical protein
MELKTINWSVINLILLVFVIIKLEFCTPPTHTFYKGTDTTIVQNSYDTAQHIINNTYNTYQRAEKINTIPAIVDTHAILKSYYASREFVTPINDSLISGFVVDSVTQNKITYNKLYYRLLRPTTTTVIKTVTTPPPMCAQYKYSIQVGMFGMSNGKNLAFGPQASYQNKKYMLGAGYDVLNKAAMIKTGIVFTRVK